MQALLAAPSMQPWLFVAPQGDESMEELFRFAGAPGTARIVHIRHKTAGGMICAAVESHGGTEAAAARRWG